MRRSLRSDAVDLGLVATVIGAATWLAFSRLAPDAAADHVAYTFTPLPLAYLVVAIGVSAVILSIAHWLVRRAIERHVPSGSVDTSYVLPLALGGSNLASLGLLWPPLAGWWTPVAFVTTDLHPIVVAVAAALSVNALDLSVDRALSRGAGNRWKRIASRFSAADRTLLADTWLALLVLLVLLVSSPYLRFASNPTGDEPKYVRYAENWWQGLGMEVGGVRDVAEIPAGESHLLRNLQLVVPALRTDLGALVADARYMGNVKHWSHRFNKAEYAGNWWVRGKAGGFYQMHGPGIAFVLLPAYAIDRALFDGHRSKFADDLFTTNLVLLTIFLLLTIAMSRLLVAAGAAPLLAMTVAGACAVSLPLSAFAFQIYPETAASLVICVACRRLLQPSPLSSRAGLAIGSALGWLGWLHVRFLPVSVVALTWLVWTHHRERRGLAGVVAAYACLFALLCLYAYHVTGSVLPTALYDAEGGREPFILHWVPGGLLGYLFDRENGIFALAPVYLLALPGLGIMLRRNPQSALIVLTLILSLVVLAAGHGYQSDGTAPLRHVLAVVPLAAVPIAVWLKSSRRHPVVFAASVAVAILSIHHAILFDLHHDKSVFTTTAPTLSGWHPSLMFPFVYLAGEPGSFDAAALIAWAVVAGMALAVGALMPQEPGRLTSRLRFSPVVIVVLLMAGLAAAGIAAIKAGAPAQVSRLLPPPLPADLKVRGYD